MNYLEAIENEFSRGRGRQSRLAPLDWDLAQGWDKRGVPLSLVLRAMGDVFKQNSTKHRPETINSLRYFTPAVEKQFAEWQSSQVGKPVSETQHVVPEENAMQNSSFAATVAHSDENVWIIETILARLTMNELPEPLRSTIAKTRGELLALLDDVQQKQLSNDKIEARLTELSVEVEIALIASTTDDERAEIIAENQKELGKIHRLPGVEHKVLIRKLYKRFGLPEITIYPL